MGAILALTGPFAMPAAGSSLIMCCGFVSCIVNHMWSVIVFMCAAAVWKMEMIPLDAATA